MTFLHLHDAAEFLVFRAAIDAVVTAAARRHLTEMGRNWKWPSHNNRSAGQKRRWEKAKGNAQ